MASIISAGTTSATALNMSADTSGVLQLAVNNGTVVLTISTAQVVGIGVTPQTWSSSNGGLQVGASFSLFSNATSYSYLGSNFYYDSAFKYIGTGRSTIYSTSDGNHVFSYANSGTGGSAITFNQAFIVQNNGNSAFGVTGPGGEKLRVEQPSSVYGNSYPFQAWAYATKQVINLQMDGSVNPIFNTDPESYWAPPNLMTWQYRGNQKLAILNGGVLYSSATVGGATIDTTGTTTAYANGATQDFVGLSGVIMATSSTTGASSMWICGGGSIALIANANGAISAGTMAYNAGAGSYRWTNNYAGTNSVSFCVIKMRGGV